MKLSFKEQFEPRVQTRAVDLVKSGSSARVQLRPSNGFHATVPVARALIRRGVPGRVAKLIAEQLVDGQSAVVEIPNFDADAMPAELKNHLVVVAEARNVDGTDVSALRKKLGFTQEQFAQRFGLRVSTIRNWEQKRSSLDGPASLLVQVMERDAAFVERVAAEDAT